MLHRGFHQARQTLMALGTPAGISNSIPSWAVPNTYTGKGGSKRD